MIWFKIRKLRSFLLIAMLDSKTVCSTATVAPMTFLGQLV